MGTILYVSPELIQSGEDGITPFDPASDVWSLGVILFNLIANKAPFFSTDNNKLMNIILQCDYMFEPKDLWDKVSSDCKDLIEKMLDPDPKLRITPAQALQHTWFQNDPVSKSLCLLSEKVVNRLRNFQKPNDMMYICHRIISSCFLDPSTQLSIREAFLHINSSDSGEITHQELQAALPDLISDEIDSIINNACQDKDRSTIKWSEFQVACIPIINPTDSEMLVVDENPKAQDHCTKLKLFNVYIHKVFAYLNIHHQSQNFLTPRSIDVVLKAQAFRFPSINIRECISSTFQVSDDQWNDKKITFETFYNSVLKKPE